MYKENAGRGMVGRQELEITETDLVTRSDKGSQSTRLSAIQGIVESPTHYFIYTSALGAYVVRKSVVEGDLPAFIAALRSKCTHATA
jgi:transglutaminase-like putative cysteine protease